MGRPFHEMLCSHTSYLKLLTRNCSFRGYVLAPPEGFSDLTMQAARGEIFFIPEVKWYDDEAFEATNKMKL